MSGDTYFGTLPQGRQLNEPQALYEFGREHPRAQPLLQWAHLHFKEYAPEELDFTRSRRKVYVKGSDEYFRVFRAQHQDAEAAGVSAFVVLNGLLVLLAPPNADKGEAKLIGTGMVGRRLHPGEALGTVRWRS